MPLEDAVYFAFIMAFTVERTFESLAMLGLLVLIRTFLSFSLEVELAGRWPWQGRDGARRND